MAFFQLVRKQELPTSVDIIWEFISQPKNLKLITPPSMGFDILTHDIPDRIYPGMIIAYHVKPILGIRMLWVTEITQVQENYRFVDEQRIGPYQIWHHQHIVEPISCGVLMTDIVSYQPPFGLLGQIANQLLIRRKLEVIFDYRQQVLKKKFEKIKV